MYYYLLTLALFLLTPQASVGQDLTPAEARQRLQDQGEDLSQSSYESAVVQGEEKVVRLYLEAGYPVNGTVETGSLELNYLELTVPEHPEVTNILLEYGADPNKPGLTSYPIHQAVPHARSMRLLLRSGANPRAISGTGWKPIHTATRLDTTSEVRTKAVQVLINYGADPDSQAGDSQTGEGDIEGATPLLLCAVLGRPSIAQVLLKNGAAPNLDNSPVTLDDGQTLSDLARNQDNASTAEIIEAYRD
ncbi:ankyrin repeat protein [Salinibacter ruber]|jgi:ankyrin repeat protein|uniref:Ankyrin repeat protein n=1 Tax=Salinibacter ruber TaxID=146919 RepID=A0A9X2TKM1_9BACT|nr:ankyrin repeat domain-containing protein [Salinibacter ruber]MCS3662029.1 ankyrin repeat protein [Salinibacter ruber]MCS3671868.1 ankyrin repeat protein [Salinibacter ruber]MCS3711824.1 ankyrin repeat protein [Salinibacter ruber]MCS4048021.1 ankyrin repeat protein [Salinibacter ruber]MCS4142071.1 ankyrin repeat protein [Salinibacter ruber]